MKKQPTITGDRLWDEILKTIVFVMPEQLFPLIKEVYGKEYPPGTPVRLLGTEQSTYLEDTKKPPKSRLMDISVVVADTDYYHIECQMKNDKFMVIRMVSYDLRYAIRHCMSENRENGELVIRFPYSTVIYPERNRALPESLQCRIIFQDGSEHVYRIPTVSVQTYSIEEIREKHLDLFVPYLLLRLKPKLKSKRHPLTEKDLTEFVNKIILLLQVEKDDGYLTDQECADYINLLTMASKNLFSHKPEFHEEVLKMTRPLITVPSMQIKDLEERLAEKDSFYKNALAEKDSALAQKDSALAERDSALAQKDLLFKTALAEIARLQAELAALSSQS